jgi:peptidoglycan/LPS O-acetylase OafA/YrhL
VMKLSELTQGRNNNLDALRLIAAFMVLLTHSFYMAGQAEPFLPFYPFRSIGSVGVIIFFVISGFLITQSFQRQSPGKFLLARALRIFPALIVVVLITVFVIGPLVTNLPLSVYFQREITYRYLLNAPLFTFQQILPGFKDVNASLWTIRYEFLLYLLLMLMGIFGAFKHRSIALGIFILNIVLFYLGVFVEKGIDFWSMGKVCWLFIYFSGGMTAYLYREYIRIDFRVFLFAVFLLVIASFDRRGLEDTLLVFPFGYIIFFIGYHPKLKLNWLTRFGDFSYGIYLWGIPILHILVRVLGKGANPLLLFVSAGCFAYIVGALSWHLLEKRALALKSRTICLPTFLSRQFKVRWLNTP